MLKNPKIPIPIAPAATEMPIVVAKLPAIAPTPSPVTIPAGKSNPEHAVPFPI